MTTRDPPLLSERDGEGFRSDLGQVRTEIFLQTGLDSRTAEQPVGQISRPVRRSSKGKGGRRNGRFRIRDWRRMGATVSSRNDDYGMSAQGSKADLTQRQANVRL